MPSNGYMGDYIGELAQEIADAEGERFLAEPEDRAVREIGNLGREKMVGLIREDLSKIGVEFDNWFSERTLYDTGGNTMRPLGQLREKGYLSQREDALWFNSTMLGDEKDNVVIRSSGEPTYFASDIAYHHNKFLGRGYDSVVNIWGADHQGHVPRVKAAIEGLGIDPERLTILIAQMVTLKRGSEVVRASKRTGDFVTLRELADEVGGDACRFFFLSRTPSTQMEFDLELAKKGVFGKTLSTMSQYAHARNAGILNLARERNIDWGKGDVSLLNDPSELALVRAMLRLPELVQTDGSLPWSHITWPTLPWSWPLPFMGFTRTAESFPPIPRMLTSHWPG